MLAEDVRILFAGFEPTADLRAGLSILLDQLYLKAPSRSFMSVTLTLTGGIFEGVLAVTSSAGDFVARATDHGAAELASKLGDGVTAQIDRWKSLRFTPELASTL